MDDKTLQALTALANKLGTTAEYLWGVLVHQAPITGAINLLMIAALVVGAATWARFVARKVVPPKETPGQPWQPAEWSDDAAIFFACASAAVLAFAAAVSVIWGLGDAVSAMVNPEYWALKQVLHLLK